MREGSIGIDINRPTNNNNTKYEYFISFRFNNYDNHERNGKNHHYEMSGYKKVTN